MMRVENKGAPRTAQETVREYLRSAILAGEMVPGSRLGQSEIAAALNVSITPVREALRDLRMEGLVDVDTFRGAVVHVPTLRELDEIFAIRSRLVPLSIELGVANITDEELSRCRGLLTEMEATRDWVRWSILNRELHRILDDAARNRRLADILGQLADVAALYIHLSLGDESDRRADAEVEHRELVEAYAQRDAAQAAHVYHEHFEGTLRTAGHQLALLDAADGDRGLPTEI
jgi:DNA-binding GntR family transcriptional regulator